MISLANSILCNVDNPQSLEAYVVNDLSIASYVGLVFAFSTFLICAFRWYYRLKRKLRLLSKTQEKSDFFFPLFYVTMTVLCIITMGLLKIYYKRLDVYDENALLVNNLIYFSYVLFNIFLSMRMVKSEVVQGLVSQNCLYDYIFI